MISDGGNENELPVKVEDDQLGFDRGHGGLKR
jgi:hypothetical protein